MAQTDKLADHIPSDAEPIADTLVVDADVHITYNATVLKEVSRYMDKPYRNYVDPDTGSDGYPNHGWPKSLGGARQFNLTGVTSPEDVYDPLCTEFGVDHPIVNVSSPVDRVLKTEQGIQEASAINDFLLDQFLDENPDFYGLATIAARDPHAAAEEIDRIADEPQIVGCFFVLGQEFNEPFGNPTYDVMYRAMEDHDLTPVYHITGLHREASILRQCEKVAEWHANGPAWAAQVTLTSLLFEGVPEKFPGLDFVLLEGGLGWLPGFIARLNREYGQWRNELPFLTKSPEEYVNERFYFGSQPLPEFRDPTHMQQILQMLGVESLMFCTDHPHYDFDHPSTLDQFLGCFTSDERNKILSGNALDAFGISG